MFGVGRVIHYKLSCCSLWRNLCTIAQLFRYTFLGFGSPTSGGTYGRGRRSHVLMPARERWRNPNFRQPISYLIKNDLMLASCWYHCSCCTPGCRWLSDLRWTDMDTPINLLLPWRMTLACICARSVSLKPGCNLALLDGHCCSLLERTAVNAAPETYQQIRNLQDN